MYCKHCGNNVQGQAFCGVCGTHVSAARTSTGLVVGLVGGAVVVAAVLAGALWLVLGGRDGSNGTATAASTSASATPSPTAPTESPAVASPSPSATAPAGLGDVRALPAGLFCRDLNARGFSYTAAVDYWRLHGQPNQMDAERNGIPCETVYSPADVTAYWGPRPQASYVYEDAFLALPGGLFCRDVAARGLSYPQAVTYWNYWGQPDNMDADLNGLPCETVYSAAEVAAYWFN